MTLYSQSLGRDLPVGSLYGIDTKRWEKGRGYTAVIAWEFRPMPVAEGEMGPFFAVADQGVTGELANCVLRVVREKLLGGRADGNLCRGHKPAGKRLTARRLTALTEADKAIAERGFTLDDVGSLEHACEIRLRCRDLAGNDLLERPASTGRAARHQVIDVTLDDNHGWANRPLNPPKITSVLSYDNRTAEALESANALQGEMQQQEATTLALLDFVARDVPKGTRTWMAGQEVITHHGVLYRTVKAARAIDEMISADSGVHPIELDDFLVSCAAGDSRDNIAFQAIEAHHKATHMIGGASTWRYIQWLESEGIRPTPDKLCDIWERSQVEAVPWNSGLDP